MLKRRYFIFSMALLGVACTSNLEVTGNPVRLKVNPSVSYSQTLNQSVTLVRASTKNSSGKRQEVRNAICLINSSQLKGRVLTPQPIVYPFFLQADRFPNRGQPDPLKIKCEANGLKGSLTVNALVAEKASQTRTLYSYNSDGDYAGETQIIGLTSQLSSTLPWTFPRTVEVILE